MLSSVIVVWCTGVIGQLITEVVVMVVAMTVVVMMGTVKMAMVMMKPVRANSPDEDEEWRIPSECARAVSHQ
jgi:hypothetical protein